MIGPTDNKSVFRPCKSPLPYIFGRPDAHAGLGRCQTRPCATGYRAPQQAPIPPRQALGLGQAGPSDPLGQAHAGPRAGPRTPPRRGWMARARPRAWAGRGGPWASPQGSIGLRKGILWPPQGDPLTSARRSIGLRKAIHRPLQGDPLASARRSIGLCEAILWPPQGDPSASARRSIGLCKGIHRPRRGGRWAGSGPGRGPQAACRVPPAPRAQRDGLRPDPKPPAPVV
jgi:hypothetical protein